MKNTILMAISTWLVKDLKIGESIKNVGTEVLEKCLWTPLQNRIIGFFTSEGNAEQFVQKISNEKARNQHKPYRDIEDLYEEIEGKQPDDKLFQEITQFLCDNSKLIKQINANTDQAEGSKIVINQEAEIIYNNKGINVFEQKMFGFNEK